jgi:hypothetical protein
MQRVTCLGDLLNYCAHVHGCSLTPVENFANFI